MQILPRTTFEFRQWRLGLLLIALWMGSDSKVAVSFQNPPIIEETIPESLRGDPKIDSLVSQLKLARRSLAGIGAAHPSYAKTKRLVEQLETSLAKEINGRMSNPPNDAAASNPMPAQPSPVQLQPSEGASGKSPATAQNPTRPVPRETMLAKEGGGVDINPPQIDLPEITAAFERLPVRRFVRLGAFPGSRILWGLEAGDGADPSRLWKWGDFDRATAQKVLLECEEKILDLQFPEDFLRSGVCYMLTVGKGSAEGNVRLLRWEILDAGDPSPTGRRETVIGRFRTEQPASGRFAFGHAQPLIVLWDQSTDFVLEDQREILVSPDRRSFLIDAHSGQGMQDTFRTISETCRMAWESWNASGPVAATNEGLLFLPSSASSDGDSIVDTTPPAFLQPSADGMPFGPSIVYRGSRMRWLRGSIVYMGGDRLTVHRIELSKGRTLQTSPIARSRYPIHSLGESSDGEILLSTEQGLATLDLHSEPTEAAAMPTSELGNGETGVSLSDRRELKSQDAMASLHLQALEKGTATWGHWGSNPDRYIAWSDHSNRLIPVYCFGGSLADYQGENSVYRSESKLMELYGQMPKETVNPLADYFDQTNLFDLQLQALQSGNKYLFLMVF
ncbi:MAG: hypothetical protein ACKN81_15540, partial [Pirellulaceae bacterium]